MTVLRILFDILVSLWIISTVWFAIRVAYPLSMSWAEESRWHKLHPGMSRRRP